MKQLILRSLAITALIASIAACSNVGAAPVTSEPPVDEAAATAIATHAFEGYNAGDYAAWTADWSASMTGAIKESDFLAIREQLMERIGRFVAIEAVAYRESKPGVHRYTFTVRFEKATAPVWFSWFTGSPKVEGVKFE